MSNEELARLLQNLIRIGNIIAVDYGDPPRARAKTGELETDWRPWLEMRAGESKTWNPPTIGEQVVIFSPGGDLAGAFFLPGINSDSNPAPSSSGDETVTKYPDGAVLSYNHASGVFDLSGVKTFAVHASEAITLDAPQTTSTGKHTVEGLLSYLAGMAGVNGAGGSTTIKGSITHSDGNLSSNGVVVHLHVHGGVVRGGSDSDGPT